MFFFFKSHTSSVSPEVVTLRHLLICRDPYHPPSAPNHRTARPAPPSPQYTTGEAKYLETAETYLKSVLSPDYFLPDADDGWQSILRRASAEHGDPELGAIFGDYFLLEAMVRRSQ